MARPPARPAERPLFIVHNPASGPEAAPAWLGTIRRVLDAAHHPYRLLPIERGGIAGAAGEAVALARRQGGALVVAGGDGTISAVVPQALAAGVPLGVIPVGTFNFFARGHGIPLEVEAATRALLDAVPVPVPVGQVNDRSFIVNASVGLYARLLDEREALARRLGRSRLVAVLAGLATLLRSHRVWRVVLQDGQGRRTVRVATLFVGNNMLQLQRTGLPGAEALAAGQLVAVVLRPAGLLQRLATLLQAARGALWQSPAIDCFSFAELHVMPRQRRRRLRVGIDGETAWLAPPLVFRRAPQPLQLLVPAGSVPRGGGA